MKFKIGDVVQLNSGSCSMTVSDVRSDGVTTAVWTDFDDVPQKISVYEECIFFVLVQP